MTFFVFLKSHPSRVNRSVGFFKWVIISYYIQKKALYDILFNEKWPKIWDYVTNSTKIDILSINLGRSELVFKPKYRTYCDTQDPP